MPNIQERCTLLEDSSGFMLLDNNGLIMDAMFNMKTHYTIKEMEVCIDQVKDISIQNITITSCLIALLHV